jgi:hypothetical protein
VSPLCCLLHELVSLHRSTRGNVKRGRGNRACNSSGKIQLQRLQSNFPCSIKSILYIVNKIGAPNIWLVSRHVHHLKRT